MSDLGGLTNGNGGISGWVKAVTALGSTGALIVIAGFLVWALVQSQRAQAQNVPQRGDYLKAQDAIIKEVNEARALVDLHVQQSDRNNDALKAILRQICVNTADDPAQRTACFTRVE